MFNLKFPQSTPEFTIIIPLRTLLALGRETYNHWRPHVLHCKKYIFLRSSIIDKSGDSLIYKKFIFMEDVLSWDALTLCGLRNYYKYVKFIKIPQNFG